MLRLLVMGTRRLRGPDQVLRHLLHRRLLRALASLPFALVRNLAIVLVESARVCVSAQRVLAMFECIKAAKRVRDERVEAKGSEAART